MIAFHEGLRTTQRGTRNTIREDLKSGYRAGFPVLREIVQNAVDRHASKVVVAAFDGEVGLGGTHPGIARPGLLFVNDGPFEASDADRLLQLADSGKIGDGSAIGRFGIGRIALLNYCDAFFFAAYDSTDAPLAIGSANPYDDTEAGKAWTLQHGTGGGEAAALIRRAVRSLGFDAKAFAIWVPLRRDASLVPEDEDPLAAVVGKTPSAILEQFRSESDLLDLFALTQLQEIGFASGAVPPAHRYRIDGERQVRRASRKNEGPLKQIGGLVHHVGPEGTRVLGRFIGREIVSDNAAFTAITASAEDSAAIRALRRERPFGSIVLVQPTDAKGLSIERASFLPLHDPSRAIGTVRLYINAAFLVRKDRTVPLSNGYEGEWNTALEDMVVSLIAPVLLDAFEGGFFKEPGTLVQAIESVRSSIDKVHAQALVRDGMLAQTVDLRTGKSKWALCAAADKSRSLPPGWRSDGGRNVPYPLDGVATMMEDRSMTAIEYGTDLSVERRSWSHDEIEAMLRASGGETLTHPTRAKALLNLLHHAQHRALSEIAGLLCRRFSADGRSQVNADTISEVVGFAAPWPVVTRPDASHNAMRAVAAVTGAPSLMRADWIPEGWQRRQMDATTLGDMLRVLSADDGAGMPGDEINLVALAAWRATRDPMSEPENKGYRVFRVENLFDGMRETLSYDMLAQRGKDDLVFAPRPDEIPRARLMARVLDLEGAVRLDAGAHDIMRSGDGLSLASLQEDAILARCTRYTGRNEDEAARLALFGMLSRPEQNHRAFRMLTLGAADDDRPLVVLSEDDRENETLSRAIAEVLAATGKALVPGAFIESRAASIKTVMKLKRIDRDMMAQAFNPLIDDKVAALDAAAREALIAWLGDAGKDRRLHADREGRLHRAVEMTREEIGGRRVPEVLRTTVPILQPARNADAARVQELLVPAWDAAREVEAFLGSTNPASMAERVLSAIDAMDSLPDSTREALQRTPWLPRPEEGPVCPSDVLTLPGEVVDASRTALDGQDAPFVLQSELDPGLTTMRGWSALAKLLPGEADSREALLLRIQDARLPARLGDGTDFNLLRVAAEAGLADQTPAGALLCALLRMEGTARDVVDAFEPLSDDEAMNARLRALGAVCIDDGGERFRPLLHAAFETAVQSAVDENVLHTRLAGTLAFSRARTFEPVQALTRIDAEVLPKHRLDRKWSDAFPEHPDEKDGEALSGAGLQGQEALLDVLKSFHEVDDEKTLRLFVLFTAQDAADGSVQERLGCTGADMSRARAALERALENAIAPEGKDVIGFYFDRNITVACQDQEKTITLVPGLTGIPFEAPLDGADDIWVKSEIKGSTCHVTLRRITEPDFDTVATMLRRCAEKMVRSTFDGDGRKQAVHGLPPRIADAVLTLFEGETASDQAGIEMALRYIDENIESRIDQLTLPRGSLVRRAQLAFREAQARGASDARRLFGATLRKEGSALAELREAVCSVIRKLGYPDDGRTTVFELYQNARDALLQATAPASRTVRVTLADDCLSLLHHGRPINGHEGDPERARELGWDRDLINMISPNQSEKQDGDIGQFGLGFKCVHILSAEPRIASGNAVAARIVGGFLPEPWPAGRRRLLEDGNKGATLIELPLEVEAQTRASTAFEVFRNSVAGLLLFTRTEGEKAHPEQIVDRIECRRAGKLDHWSVTVEPVINRIDRVAIAGSDGAQTWMTIRCEGGGTLALLLKDGIPVSKSKGADFWQLAPLSGLSDTAAWMLDGPFDVDAGRMNMQGDEKDRGPIVQEATLGLGDALIALYDAGADVLDDGIDPNLFWSELSSLFIDDCGANALMRRALHNGGRGWSQLAAARAVLPDITGEPHQIDANAHHRLSDDLAARAEAIVALGRGKGLFGTALTSAAGEVLGLANMSAGQLLEDELGRDPMVTPDRADKLYDVFCDLPGLLEVWRRARFYSMDDTLHPPQTLDLEGSERSSTLHLAYGQKGRAIVRMVQIEQYGTGGEENEVV